MSDSEALAATADVFTAKVAVVATAATDTVGGTVALVEFEVSATAIPPFGAGLPRVTVPVAELPPITDDGVTARDVTDGATIVKIALKVTP